MRLKHDARAYAQSDTPLLITGETGTGKELVARAVHALSARAGELFVPINCAAFSPQLVESELFGHEAGAFTGAVRAKKGLLRVADRGTLLLDEVADLPAHVQPKMLRVLQFGTFYPIGSETERRVDLRIISATNRPLHEMNGAAGSLGESGLPGAPGAAGTLRDDLLYRLNALHLHIPPLRERPEDIPLILNHLAARRGLPAPQLSGRAKSLLCGYSFPGNVRELENLLEKLQVRGELRRDPEAVVSAEALEELLYHGGSGGCAEDRDTAPPNGMAPPSAGMPPNGMASPNAAMVPNGFQDAVARALGNGFSLSEYLEGVEREIIDAALKSHSGNVSQAARALGISRQGLKNKINRYGIGR